MYLFIRLVLVTLIGWSLCLNLNYYLWTSFFEGFFERFGFWFFLIALLAWVITLVKEVRLPDRIITFNSVLAWALVLLILPWIPDLFLTINVYFDWLRVYIKEAIFPATILCIIIVYIGFYLSKIQYIPNLLFLTKENVLGRSVKYLAYLFSIISICIILSFTIASVFDYIRAPSCDNLNRSLSESSRELYFNIAFTLGTVGFVLGIVWLMVLILSVILISILWKKESDIASKRILRNIYVFPILLLNILYIPIFIFIFLLIWQFCFD